MKKSSYIILLVLFFILLFSPLIVAGLIAYILTRPLVLGWSIGEGTLKLMRDNLTKNN